MSFDKIIKQGTIVNANETIKADIGITGEKISAIALSLEDPQAEVIDATGCYVIPGGIDVHVHLQLPFCGTVSADDFETGTRAAAASGITTLIDYATQDRENGLMAGIEKRMKEAEGRVYVDYALHSIITKLDKETQAEMKRVVEFGIPSFKMFMIYEAEGWQSDDRALFNGLTASREIGARILVHAESEKVMSLLIAQYKEKIAEVGAYGHVLSRPNFIEAEAIQRVIKWAEVTGGRLYIVHMSTKEGVDLVKAAKDKGIDVYAETCPQYLLLDDEVFKNRETGHLYATCPQIKKKADSQSLWQGLKTGIVSVVATDTCTFNTKQKAMWNGDFTKIPFGLPGVETLLPAVYTHGVKSGLFSINHYVSLISTQPAKIFGLFPRKGTISVSSDADITIFNPHKVRKIDYQNLETNCDWSPFQGMELTGFPDTTLCRGTIVFKDGKVVGKKGQGQFLKRAANTAL